MGNENDILVKLVLDDELQKQFAASMAKVQTDAAKTEKAVSKVGDAAQKDATKGVQAFADKAGKGFNETAEKVGALTGQVSNFGNNVLAGNLPGAMQSFVMVAVQGFKTVGTSAAIATGGISVAVAGIIYLVKSAIDENEKLKEIQKTATETITDLETRMQSFKKSAQEKEKKAADDFRDDQLRKNKAAFETDLKTLREKWALTEEGEVTNRTGITAAAIEAQDLYKIKLAEMKKYEQFINQEHAEKMIDIEVKYYWEPLEAQRGKDASATKESNDKKATQVKSLSDLFIAGQELVGKFEYKNRQDLDSMLIAAAEEFKNQKLRIAQAEQDERLNMQIEAWQREQQQLANQAARYEDYAMAVGTALTAGIGKGAEGLKESLKAMLTLFLSAIEKEVLLGYVGAGARALAGDFTGLIQMAGVTAAFETAKIGVSKFGKGADYTTSGPQLIMVGDNPGGKERVQVTPLSSPNYNGPRGGGGNVSVSMGNVYVSGNADSGTVRAIADTRERQLRRMKKDLQDLMYAGQLPW